MEGIVLTTSCCKAFVASSTNVLALAGLGGLIEEATRSGCKDKAPILWQTITKPTAQVAAILKLRDGSKIVEILWMLRSNGTPASLCTACFPADLWARCVGRNLGDRSSYRLLQQRLGPQVKWAREIIDCCRAPKRVAALLQIKPSTVVLACQREVFLEDGTPAEYATAYARGDLLKFTFERRRQQKQRGAGTGAVRTSLASILFQQLHR
jgi:DNA-binding GntR family transcriptional regulator